LQITSDAGGDGFGFSEVAFGVSSPVTVPEPASLALFGLGTLGLAGWRLRRQHSPR
jgi:hypothetical protein